MKQPDFEHYYKLKGRLEDAMHELPEDSPLRFVAMNNLRRCEQSLVRLIDLAIQDGIEDMHYIKEMIDAASS